MIELVHNGDAGDPQPSVATGRKPAFAPWLNSAAKPIVLFEGVNKKFGSFAAIENLNLKIYPREFFALLGPSGCGKTTLMRMLAGFEQPTSGFIWLNGVNVSPIPANKRPVNMMFQSYALFPHLSVWDNIAFGLKRERLPRDRIADRVGEMLRLTRLEKFASRRPHQISGGQRQRVALARALARAPQLLLLDEPLAALDKKLRHETQFELMDIQEKTGTTFVIVTHDQEEAMTVASRIAVMDHGKLVQVDTPSGIYENPASVYVANFIGEANIIEGTVVQAGGKLAQIAYAEGATPLAAAHDGSLQVHQRVFYAIRPEKVQVSQRPIPDLANCVRGRVLDIAYVGNVSTYNVKLAGGAILKAQMTNVQRSAAGQFGWDEEVTLNWADDAGVVLTQ